jgi:hypothetical protein
MDGKHGKVHKARNKILNYSAPSPDHISGDKNFYIGLNLHPSLSPHPTLIPIVS